MQAAGQMLKLYDVVYDNDVTMLEINPMVEALDPSGKKTGEMYEPLTLHRLMTC